MPPPSDLTLPVTFSKTHSFHRFFPIELIATLNCQPAVNLTDCHVSTHWRRACAPSH